VIFLPKVKTAAKAFLCCFSGFCSLVFGVPHKARLRYLLFYIIIADLPPKINLNSAFRRGVLILLEKSVFVRYTGESKALSRTKGRWAIWFGSITTHFASESDSMCSVQALWTET